ncbi:MAG: ABC transporter permease subunit [Oscillospiraceae bacterium]|nr:ABC transporter permease subunit [Oscillospiraceae bacterium]
MKQAAIPLSGGKGRAGFWYRLKRDLSRNYLIYLLALPALVYYFIYHYWPMYGAVIAFKDFSPAMGIWGSPWAGTKYFQQFFNSAFFIRTLRNTLMISLYSILWSFPAPILLALLMNEIRSTLFKRTVQTVTYMPHFISTVVICGMLIDFCSMNGLFNSFTQLLGMEAFNFLMKPELFRTIYIASGIWQEVGWGSIIYLAALTSIDASLYEAARIDGAGRFRQMTSITLPGIAPTIVIMLILRMGQVMNVGFEKIMLLYNPATYEVADVISTFVYRKGIVEANYSYSAAVGLFNSVINFVLVVTTNWVSRHVGDGENSLW